jgi:Protein of unknown function (DUF3052)
MISAVAGYSGTPLAKKLGIKDGARVFLVNAPGDYARMVAPLPGGVRMVKRIDHETDLIHIFTTRRRDLDTALLRAMKLMRPNAAIWVSWPKRSSGAATDVTEDTIREVALPLGLVDIKVCAVDDTWSGLKLVIRKERRAR